ncbi:MAG: rubrerythrin family protein [Oscillospiraceae bacterium]|nr:rubrerythrin family protein [Oscillospiraceae bacterium]
MNLQNSETQKNLMRALAGESLARNRYTFAAQQAEQEGLPVIAAVFRYTAGQEKEHAEIFADFLRQGGADSVCVEGDFPVDTAADTLSLLAAAVQNEAKEQTEVYPAFAAVARSEGFAEVARKLELIAEIEKCHAGRFEAFRKLLSENRLYVSQLACNWICLNCGHELNGTAAPQSCPVCGEAGYFIRVEMSPYDYSGVS